MAGYRKRGYGRSKKYRKGYSKKKKYPSTKTLSKKIKHIENDLIELKFCDVEAGTEATQLQIDVAGTVVPLLDGIVTGTGNAQDRTGNQINVTSLQMRCDCNYNFVRSDSTALPNGYANPAEVRVLIFWDRQANAGLYPTLYELDTSYGGPSADSLLDGQVVEDLVRAPINYNAIDRFKIVFDHRYTINPIMVLSAVQATGPPVTVTTDYSAPWGKKIDKYMKMARKVKYYAANADPAAAGSTNVLTNALYVAFVSSIPANAPNKPLIKSGYRVYFRDA